MRGTDKEWLIEMLFAFNSGNLFMASAYTLGPINPSVTVMVICVLLYQLLHIAKMGSSWHVCSLLKQFGASNYGVPGFEIETSHDTFWVPVHQTHSCFK